ncbi:macrophage erythroblast attacher-like protein [Carex littledalei]|uniref:Macrophage erythroblast attacher-like protein n=1 Tax=Carex littledalei TaxID=544730 RepID=A0A833QGX1_9POAL|nr:macrophage erythroblast attacher-like protein [Carex littledalei]
MVIDPPVAAAEGGASEASSNNNGHGEGQTKKKKTPVTEILKLELQLLRVPVEHLKKSLRSSQRTAEKDLSAVLADISSVTASPTAAAVPPVSSLTSLVCRLHGIKRKLEESSSAEAGQVQRCRARIEHLEEFVPHPHCECNSNWNNTRLNRVILDYMLRMSYYDSATLLADSANIQELVDIDVFVEAREVVESLQNKKVAPALTWCAENKSRLKKTKSKLEFLLRLQEFIEMVKANDYLRAIAYARKYLAPWGPTYTKELQRVTATLAFKSGTNCSTYKVLFDECRWDFLVEEFKQEFCKLFGMTLVPLLQIYLQAGLSALKTPSCPQGMCPKEDPLSQAGFMRLAEPLPFSKQHHSKLVCFITKELMDTENPPLVLPNGYVYSTKALEEMAKNNDGKITCPRTGYECNFSDLVKAFIS